jgi:putative membrane-bound dehydrogenase-like protein
VAETSKVFAEDPELVSPLGICALGSAALVSCSPNLLLYTDDDGDDRADRREVVLTGFGGFDHDHGLHSLVIGPDGRWYAAVGNAGPHLVADRGGFDLRSGSIYRDGGPALADNMPGLRSSDGRVWTGGLVLRLEPDFSGLAVVAHNFRNEYEVALDSAGNAYTADNDDDGSRACRTVWVMEGASYGYFAADGSRFWNADRRPGQDVHSAHWHQDDPGIAPMGTVNGAGGPTGVAVYENGPLARFIGGAVLDCDAGARAVYSHVPHASGAGIELEKGVFIAPAAGRSDRAAEWFRPSDVCVALDGSVLVADWWDPGVGGHAMGDSEAYGRILRIAEQGSRPARASVDLATRGGRLAALASPAATVRGLAARGLLADGLAAAAELEAIAEHGAEPWSTRAAWLAAMIAPDGAFVGRALAGAGRSEQVIPVFRALCAVGVDTSAWLERLPELAGAVGWREALIAMRDLPPERKLRALLEAKGGDLVHDRWLQAAYAIGAEGAEERLWSLWRDLSSSSAASWTAADALFTWLLHPPAAVPDLETRALDAELDPLARREAIDSLGFIGERAAAEAMLTVAQAGPVDQRAYAEWWLRFRSTNDWREHGVLEQLGGAADFGRAEKVWASGVVGRGGVPVDVDVSGAGVLWLVATDAGDGNSCDWCDWIEPQVEHIGGSAELAERPWLAAEAEWGSVQRGLNCEGGLLAVDGEARQNGIGTHADSKIAFKLPTDARRFSAWAAVDDGGTRQADDSPTSVVFEVWLERGSADSEDLTRERLVLDASADPEARAAAAHSLSVEPAGGMWLVGQAQSGALGGDLRAAAAPGLYANPDFAVRALASEHFARPGEGGRELPSLAELAALPGDARAGERAFFGERARCSACHAFRGRGGDVGPDLTAIRAKYGREALLDAILNPSAAIAFGYDSWLVETNAGAVVAGFVLADGADLVIKDTQSKRHVIPATEIASRRRQKLSVMPDGLAVDLSPADLADLASYLLADHDAPPVYGEEIALFDGRNLEGWTHFLADVGAAPEDTWSVEDGVLRCAGAPTGYIRTVETYTSFALTLEWRFDPERGAGNSGVLLRMVGADQIWPKSIEAQLHSGNAGDIWNIGEFPMQADAGRTEGRRTRKAAPCSEKPLGEWNRYEIVLDGGELSLTVNGVLQNTASWCEEVAGSICLQSEGAWIEFRDIRLKPIAR